jgi:hypothetical protein
MLLNENDNHSGKDDQKSSSQKMVGCSWGNQQPKRTF